ncbi:MAG: SUMF1/EgtB/PvdO family nonheme iron enzyme [Saprospiraceae bacterium]|nr:SUMF1/EgtB/PvdO family nonheme iron enzyme [Saprospiraceae bacterium]
MKQRLTLLLLPLFLAAPILLRSQCCCCIKREAGQKLYDQGKYEAAVAKWKEGLDECGDAPDDCPDLSQRIANANVKIKERDRAAAQRRREQEEQQRRNQEAELQRLRNKADDDLWEALKDGDAAACDKYLAKYPYPSGGRHSREAYERKKQLMGTALGITPVRPPGNGGGAQNEAWKQAFAWVEGGTFQMGDVLGDNVEKDETVHTVTVASFFISKTELSFDEYDAFCIATNRAKPSDNGWGRGRRPVINVSWYDAIEYCNWRSVQENLKPVYTIDKGGQDPKNTDIGDMKKWGVAVDWAANGYRLPTEAEWEYAARARGKNVRFGNGRDIIDPTENNFTANDSYKNSYSVVGQYPNKTVSVDEMSANSLGIKSMSGNVYELCWDWYNENYYGQSDGAKNPRGATSGHSRVCRGGSWRTGPSVCRVSNRHWLLTHDQRFDIGFRLTRSN